MTDAEIRGIIDREVASRVDKAVPAEMDKFTMQAADDISITGSGRNITVGRSQGAAAPKAGAGSGTGAPNKSVIITDNGVANIYTIPATLIGPA